VKVAICPAITVSDDGVTVTVITLALELLHPFSTRIALHKIPSAMYWIVRNFITDISPKWVLQEFPRTFLLNLQPVSLA
jgi:hypothetical protein